MKKLFAPGCALLIYKPNLAEKIFVTLKKIYHDIEWHETCCHHSPENCEPVKIINVCPGCNRRYKSLYKDVSTVSLWEIFADMKVDLPDHTGKRVTVLDACPTANEKNVQKSIRVLLNRMNIAVTEAEQPQKCCGDTFYGKIPSDELIRKMKERAGEMPEDNVVVYCVSCVKSTTNGGKRAIYLPDLLFGEETQPGDCDPDRWHKEIDEFIEAH